MSIYHSRYRWRSALAFNYKYNGARGRFHNAKRHAGASVRQIKRTNKFYTRRGKIQNALRRYLR